MGSIGVQAEGISFYKASFKDALAKAKAQDKLVFIDAYTTWCGPCKAMAPVLKRVKNAVGEDATIVKINVDNNQALSMKYNIRSIPTFMLFKNGEMKWHKVGMTSEGELKAVIEKNAVVEA